MKARLMKHSWTGQWKMVTDSEFMKTKKMTWIVTMNNDNSDGITHTLKKMKKLNFMISRMKKKSKRPIIIIQWKIQEYNNEQTHKIIQYQPKEEGEKSNKNLYINDDSEKKKNIYQSI